MGCVWKYFRPSQIAADIAVRTYVDTGAGVDANGSFIRPKVFPDTSHTLLRHLDEVTVFTGKGI